MDEAGRRWLADSWGLWKGTGQLGRKLLLLNLGQICPYSQLASYSRNFLADPPLPRDGTSRQIRRIESLIPISPIICLFVEYFICMNSVWLWLMRSRITLGYTYACCWYIAIGGNSGYCSRVCQRGWTACKARVLTQARSRCLYKGRGPADVTPWIHFSRNFQTARACFTTQTLTQENRMQAQGRLDTGRHAGIQKST